MAVRSDDITVAEKNHDLPKLLLDGFALCAGGEVRRHRPPIHRRVVLDVQEDVHTVGVLRHDVRPLTVAASASRTARRQRCTSRRPYAPDDSVEAQRCAISSGESPST